MGGRTEVRTKSGAILTIIILSLTLVFGLVKLQHLLVRKNPLINTNFEPLADDAVFDNNSGDLMLAVTVENYMTGASLTDLRYIKWLTSIWQRIEGVLVLTWYPMHKCNKREYERFKKA